MTPQQIRSQLKLYRLTVAGMARDLGIHRQSAHKAINGHPDYHRITQRVLAYVESLGRQKQAA